MRHSRTAAILTQHSVAWRKSPSGRLLAFDIVIDASGNDASQWVDVSEFSQVRLMAWLGY
jgi:hypothetical protein